jgi:chromosome segregation ATPase
VQTSTLDVLTSQIAGLTETLQKTQHEVIEAKKAADSVLDSNSELRKELDEVKSAANSANSLLKLRLDAQGQKKDRLFSFTHKDK